MPALEPGEVQEWLRERARDDDQPSSRGPSKPGSSRRGATTHHDSGFTVNTMRGRRSHSRCGRVVVLRGTPRALPRSREQFASSTALDARQPRRGRGVRAADHARALLPVTPLPSPPAAARTSAALFDLTRFSATRALDAVVGGTLVNRDVGHMSDIFAATLGPGLSARARDDGLGDRGPLRLRGMPPHGIDAGAPGGAAAGSSLGRAKVEQRVAPEAGRGALRRHRGGGLTDGTGLSATSSALSTGPAGLPPGSARCSSIGAGRDDLLYQRRRDARRGSCARVQAHASWSIVRPWRSAIGGIRPSVASAVRPIPRPGRGGGGARRTRRRAHVVVEKPP